MVSIRAIGAFIALSSFASPVWAQADAGTFKSREVRILVGYATGGGYDTYARIVGQHVGKYLPGTPTVIVQNMPGADGLTVTNHVFSRAAKDGSVIALTNRNIAVGPALGLMEPQTVQYQAHELYWIANLNAEVSVIVVRSDLGITALEEIKNRPVIVGATGLTSNNALYPYVTNNLLNTRFKVVSGYPGTSHLVLALERGEIEGIGGWAWSSIQIQKPDWIRDKTITPLLQLSLEKHPDLANVPLIMDFAKTDEDRQALELIFAPESMGRPFFGPPGLDPAAGKALRAAFVSLAKDEGFKASAEKAKLDVSFMDGEALQAMVSRIAAASPGAVALAKKLTQRGNTEVLDKQ
jgi:tripartite-type tricarboxylate transporter receptor subunit TctC